MTKLFKSLAFYCVVITSCQAVTGLAANLNLPAEQFGTVIHQSNKDKASNSRIQRSYIVVLDESPLLVLKGARSYRSKSTDPSGGPVAVAKIQTQLSQINAQQDDFISSVTVGIPDASISKRYNMIVNAVVVSTNDPKASDILRAKPGVKYVVEDSIVKAHMSTSLPLIKAPEAWSLVGGRDSAGAGVRVAIIDSGIVPEHPMFEGINFEAPSELPDDDYCATVDPSFCNGKLIVARHYTPTNMDESEVDSPYDRDGHGVHVAGTAVGNTVVNAQGTELSGVAPGAYLMAYKALWSDGSGSASGSTSGLIQALEDAVSDGADVINNSWGGTASVSSLQLYSDIFARIEAAGVVVTTSAGNSGPSVSTVGCPACAPAGLAVASTNTQSGSINLSVVSTGMSSYSAIPGADVSHTTDISAEAIPASAADNENSDACAPFDADSFTGGIGIAYRGGATPLGGPCYFYIKATNLKNAGARGMIIINNVPGDAIVMGGLTDLTFPSVMISQDEGVDLLSNLTSGDSITIGAFQNSVIPVGAVSGFSSRGPNIDPQVLKPDISAPGSVIFSAAIGSTNSAYVGLSGTSMASPHVAGAAAVVKQSRPELTAVQIKSALMNSANPSAAIAGSGNGPAGIFASGAGALDLESALSAKLLFETSSLSENCFSSCEFEIRGSYHGEESLSLSPRLELSDSNAVITLATSFEVSPGASFELPFSIDVSSTAEGWLTGRIVVEDPSQTISLASIPISVDVGTRTDALVLDLEGNITPGVTSSVSLALAGAPDASAGESYTLTVANPSSLTLNESSVIENTTNVTNTSLEADSATGQVRWSGVLGELNGSIQPSDFFATGLSLKSDFEGAITARLNCADDTAYPDGCDDLFWSVPVTNHNIMLAGATIEKLAVSTNGLVVTNHTDEDISANTYSPQKLPLNNRPNNVIAPFWTDLVLGDGGSDGDVVFGIIENGLDKWVVIEWWNATEYGQAGPTHTFSLWLKEGGGEAYINYADLGELPTLLSVGVEDARGASGVNHFFSGTGEAPLSNSSLLIDVSSYKGSAELQFDVAPIAIAEVENSTIVLPINTLESIDLSSLTTLADVNDEITASLDVSGQRYSSSLSFNYPSESVSYQIVAEPSNGQLTLSNTQESGVASSFDYAPNDGFVGTDFFTFEVVDSANSSHKSATASVSITVEDTRPDSDGDGLSDERELEIGTDPQNPDSDGDGLMDGEELELGTDPIESDTDGDGVSDGKELELGIDPVESDTDGDGVSDGEELELGTDPVESDTDGDGVSDGDEVAAGTDPTDEGSRPEIVVEDELHRGLPVWMMYLINTLESTRSSEKVGEQLKP